MLTNVSPDLRAIMVAKHGGFLPTKMAVNLDDYSVWEGVHYKHDPSVRYDRVRIPVSVVVEAITEFERLGGSL